MIMEKYNLKNYASLSIAFALITWILLILYSEGSLEITKNALFQIPKVVTINVVLWTIFIKWLWKFSLFRNWLVPFPNLSGNWSGKVVPNSINPATNEVYNPVDIDVKIKQTLLSIHIKVTSNEMESNSYSASFIVNNEISEKRLCYSYLSKPKSNIRNRSPIHDGTTLLSVVGKDENDLEGEYWTNRNSTGEIYLFKLHY